MRILRKIDDESLVIYLDKHQSHKSPVIRTYLERKGIEFRILPPNCSYLNPVELYWSAFKKRFRLKQINQIDWTRSDFLEEIDKSMSKVTGVKNMARKGALKFMIEILKKKPEDIVIEDNQVNL